MSLLLETILTAEKVESSIVGGIQVLLVLLGQRASKYDENILQCQNCILWIDKAQNTIA